MIERERERKKKKRLTLFLPLFCFNSHRAMASRRENALDLAKFVDAGVRVKLSGGREGE